MHIKAKQAMDKAKEFICKKQMRQWIATSSAAEHAMQQKGSLGRVGAVGIAAGTWKTAYNVTPSTNSSSVEIPCCCCQI
jgi:hypothetical protein